MSAVRRLEAVGRERASGESAKVAFDPEVHPGIVLRMGIQRMGPDRIAAAIGVSLRTLTGWMERYPELREARELAGAADEAVVASLFQLAIGWRNPDTGKRIPPNVAAAIFWLKARLKWSDQPPPPEPPKILSRMTSEELEAEAQSLLKSVERTVTIEAKTDGEAGF